MPGQRHIQRTEHLFYGPVKKEPSTGPEAQEPAGTARYRALAFRGTRAAIVLSTRAHVGAIRRWPTMIRLANPGSDIDGMTRFLQALTADLSLRGSFSLDDMRDVAIARNLMTAYGFSGDEAVVRSTRPDRSRDGLFNNCKMYSELYRLLGWVRPTTSKAQGRLTWLGEHLGTVGPDYKGLVSGAASNTVVEGPATRLFRSCVDRVGRERGKVIDALMTDLRSTNRGEFYPLVADLFRVLGFDCATARSGVNYQRADAFITHAQMSVPIEIKSPGEEQFISVKGVRQAAENKVILLARKAAPTTRDATSLVVGYMPPNERAEVGNLMDDIFSAFNITIGLIDLRALLHLAFGCLYGGRRVDPPSILRLRGFINVIDA